MTEFVFRRSFSWLQKALEPISPASFPTAVGDSLIPTLDIFGTSRLGEVQVEQVLGDPAGLEVTHDAVASGRARYYLAAAYWHQQDGNQFAHLSAGIVYAAEGLPSFPFVPFSDLLARVESGTAGVAARSGRVAGTANPPLENTQVLRGLWVGPGSRFAVRAGSLVNPQRLGFRVAWVDLALGERIGFR